MRKRNQAMIFCLDEGRSFTADIAKRFSDTTKYRVLSCSSKQDFMKELAAENDKSLCRVAVLVINEVREDGSHVERLTKEIHTAAADMGLILVFPPEKGEEIRKAARFNIEAYIPRNSNSILRLHNVVKRLISKHNLEIYHKRRNLSLWILLAFILIAITIFLANLL